VFYPPSPLGESYGENSSLLPLPVCRQAGIPQGGLLTANQQLLFNNIIKIISTSALSWFSPLGESEGEMTFWSELKNKDKKHISKVA